MQTSFCCKRLLGIFFLPRKIVIVRHKMGEVNNTIRSSLSDHSLEHIYGPQAVPEPEDTVVDR